MPSRPTYRQTVQCSGYMSEDFATDSPLTRHGYIVHWLMDFHRATMSRSLATVLTSYVRTWLHAFQVLWLSQMLAWVYSASVVRKEYIAGAVPTSKYLILLEKNFGALYNFCTIRCTKVFQLFRIVQQLLVLQLSFTCTKLKHLYFYI